MFKGLKDATFHLLAMGILWLELGLEVGLRFELLLGNNYLAAGVGCLVAKMLTSPS